MRILIVQTAFLGDVVLTLPLIEAVRGRFPQAQVEVVTIPAHAAVLRDQPHVDAVLTYDKRGRGRGWRGLWRMMRTLRRRGYDLALSPHRSLRTALLVAGSGIPQRVGFRQWWTRWAYSVTVPRLALGHEVERNHQLLTLLPGLSVDAPRQFALQAPMAAQQAARQYFAQAGVGDTDVVIGIIPGSQWGTKRWPAACFATLIEQLTARPQTHCALFGAPPDHGIARAITAACRAPVLDLIGKTTLRELPAYMACCSLVVSNDTGPMHIAAALGKPIVTLYGPTTAALGFAPYGVPWEDASVPLDCRPCHAHGPQRCPLGHWRCMRDLSVGRVLACVQRLLHRTRLAGEVEV